jgi:hypothetical protein
MTSLITIVGVSLVSAPAIARKPEQSREQFEVGYGATVDSGPMLDRIAALSDPPLIRPSAPIAMGSMDKEQIRQVIRRNIHQIRACYEAQLAKHPTLAGKISIRFVIAVNGTVSESNVAQASTNNPELETCLATHVRTWIFPNPKGGGVVIVTYPFIFKPASAAGWPNPMMVGASVRLLGPRVQGFEWANVPSVFAESWTSFGIGTEDFGVQPVVGLGVCAWPSGWWFGSALQELFVAGGARFGPAQGPYTALTLKYVFTNYAGNLLRMSVEVGYRWRFPSGLVVHASAAPEARLYGTGVMFFGVHPGMAVGWAL